MTDSLMSWRSWLSSPSCSGGASPIWLIVTPNVKSRQKPCHSASTSAPFEEVPVPHPHSLFDADGVKAALIFTPCPGTQGSPIDEALADLKAAGADALVTVMPEGELADNNASNIEQLCQEAGLAWFHLPVADDAAPGDDF